MSLIGYEFRVVFFFFFSGRIRRGLRRVRHQLPKQSQQRVVDNYGHRRWRRRPQRTQSKARDFGSFGHQILGRKAQTHRQVRIEYLKYGTMGSTGTYEYLYSRIKVYQLG